MAEVFEYIKPFEKKAIDFFQQRIEEIDDEQGRLASERALYAEMIKRLHPCPKCGGQGELCIQVDQDHSEFPKCPSCGGTGIRDRNVTKP